MKDFQIFGRFLDNFQIFGRFSNFWKIFWFRFSNIRNVVKKINLWSAIQNRKKASLILICINVDYDILCWSLILIFRINITYQDQRCFFFCFVWRFKDLLFNYICNITESKSENLPFNIFWSLSPRSLWQLPSVLVHCFSGQGGWDGPSVCPLTSHHAGKPHC